MKTNSEDYRGWWLLLIEVVLQFAGAMIALFWFTKVFDSSLYPSGTAPFYFIVRDFFQGVFAAISLFLILIIGFVNLKKYRIYARAMMLFSILYGGGSIGRLIIISFKTSNLLTPELAESSWTTFDEYLHDPMIWIARVSGFVLYLALGLLYKKLSKSQPIPGTDPDKPDRSG